jgi:glycosyltransferase involved in cell wall biosynthesis
MKINYTMFGTGLTGGVRVLFDIVNRLVDRGHEVTITSLGNENDHNWFPLKAEVKYVQRPFINKIVNYGIKRVFGINMSPFPYSEIEELIKAIPECDINVATQCFSAFSVFTSDKGVPFYHMQHYEPLFFNEQNIKKLAEETYYLPLNKIANSIWLKNQMKEKYEYDLPVVNPAIDHDVFYPKETDKKASKFRVLCFGKQTRWKGFLEALEAMKVVMKKRDNVEFIAYGMKQPTYESDVPYKFVESPSDVELASLYSSADVMVCPSWYESFPLFPLEAMACGAPVVTTPYGTEDYAFHEKNCLVVPPKDPKALADAVLRLLNDGDMREKIGKEGPETAKQFTWDKTVDKVEKLFKEALLQ